LYSRVIGDGPRLNLNHREDWEGLRVEFEELGFYLPSYDPRGKLYMPNKVYGILKELDLKHNDCAWERLAELVEGPGVLTEPLWNKVNYGIAYENIDPKKREGGPANQYGIKPGYYVRCESDRICTYPKIER